MKNNYDWDVFRSKDEYRVSSNEGTVYERADEKLISKLRETNEFAFEIFDSLPESIPAIYRMGYGIELASLVELYSKLTIELNRKNNKINDLQKSFSIVSGILTAFILITIIHLIMVYFT